jgi:hypothetical protein
LWFRESTITGLGLYSSQAHSAGVSRYGGQVLSLLLHVLAVAAIVVLEPFFQEVEALPTQRARRVQPEMRVLYLNPSTLSSMKGYSLGWLVFQHEQERQVEAAKLTDTSNSRRVLTPSGSGESRVTLLQSDVPVLSATPPEIQTPAIALSRVAVSGRADLAPLAPDVRSEQKTAAPAAQSTFEVAEAPPIAPSWSGAQANIDILSIPSLPIPIPAAIEIPKVAAIAGPAVASVESGTGDNTRADSARIADATAAVVPGSGADRLAASDGSMRFAELTRSDSGQNDAVVMQADMSIPGSHGLLTGKPVYTVYVPVAGGTEWILQYCLPNDRSASGSSAPNSSIITMEAAPAVAAPFALRTFRPEISFRAPVRYAFVHGYIGTDGKFESLTEVGMKVLDAVADVLRAISQWEFRPVMAEGHSIRVEALVGIPKLEGAR